MLSTFAGGIAMADDTAPPSGFPSWSDVQNAKGSESAKSAEVGTINTLLDGLQSQSEALGSAAVKAGADYAQAKSALDAASTKVAVLSAQTQRATDVMNQYRKQAGALAAQSYKTAGTNLGVLVAMGTLSSADALQQLDLAQAVTSRTSDLYNKSSQAQGTAKALTEQEAAAKAERSRLAGEAQSKLDSAVAAQKAMDAQVATEKQQSQVLVAQLADLKNTTAAVEDQYRQGVAAQAAYEAAQEAKRQAAAAEALRQQQAAAAAAAAAQPVNQGPPPVASQPSGKIPVNVLLPVIPDGAVNDPAGAQAYASSQLGAYGWGGDQFGCLLQLWNQESNWRTNATNPDSGAYGIAQALPPGKYITAGGDWLTNYRTQVNWGLGYIRDRYGSPCGAWAHEGSNNWY